MKIFLSALFGGAIGGALLGLLEAGFHIVNQGLLDGLAPFYAVGLYGLVGLGFGTFAGLLALGIHRVRALQHPEAFGHVLGFATAIVPMAGFILHYLANKVVWAEQGVPLTGKLAILAILGVFTVFEFTIAYRADRGPLLPVAKPAGSAVVWALLLVATGAIALMPWSTDPRDAFAHGKPVPAALQAAPNVLILTIDTLRADALGAYGREGADTPVLDGLANDGILFENASAHSSWTRSSFASLWSSRLPSSHATATKASRLPDELTLLSEVAQNAGMATANLANNINVTETFNFDQGYDTFLYESPAYPFGASESVFSLTLYKVVHKLREKLGGSKQVERYYQPANVVLADAKRFIEANTNSRWMLSVHLMEPHDPYFEHPYLNGGTEVYNGNGYARAEVEKPDGSEADALAKLYADEVRHLDRELAPFVDWLKAQGHYQGTLIVLTADHGEEFFEHGGFWHGTTLYEEQLHVPLLVKPPGATHAGRRAPWTVRLIDVAPTITGMLGLAPDPSWQGEDLMKGIQAELASEAALALERDEAQAAVAAFSEAADAGTLEPEDRETLFAMRAKLEPNAPSPCVPYERRLDRPVVAEQDFEGNVLKAVKEGGFKLLLANEGNPRGLPASVLFDVVADPGESTPLSPTHTVCGASASSRQAVLTATLTTLLTQAESGAAKAEDAKVDANETCNLCALGYLSGPQCDDC